MSQSELVAQTKNTFLQDLFTSLEVEPEAAAVLTAANVTTADEKVRGSTTAARLSETSASARRHCGPTPAP